MPDVISRATIRLSNGKYANLVDFKPEDLDIFDINNSLNHIYRFTGHYKDRPPLTVAQHTKLVVQLCNMIFPGEIAVELDCCIHDWAEAFTGDVASPLKNIFGQQFKDYETAIEDKIYARYWFLDEPFTEEIKQKRKICDLLSLDIERRSMWSDQRGKAQWPSIPMESIFPLKRKIETFELIQSQGDVDLVEMYDDIFARYQESTNGSPIPTYVLGE